MRSYSLLVVSLLCSLATISSAAAGDVVFARDLSVSPDGQTIAFSWAGDVWTVPVAGGNAKRLTVNTADDRYPIWSRDGKLIAFTSRRHGPPQLFLMDADGGALRRLTFDNAAAIPTDFSPDGKWIYFHAQREGEMYEEHRAYRVPVAGGQVWRALDCYARDVTVSPDGKQIAFARGGLAWIRLSRRNYRGPANYDVYVCPADGRSFTRVTNFDGADRAPKWAADGLGFYFLSDRSGPVNVWFQSLGGGEPEQITRMTGDDVRDFSLSADGRTLAFNHWDKVYVMSTGDRRAREIVITVPEDTAANDVSLKTFTNKADEQEPSPDGKEIALVVHGEIFVIKTKDDKPTRRVTDSPARDHDVTWSPDGKAIFFVSDRDGQEDIYRATSAEKPAKALSESLRFRIERITDNPELEYGPKLSPDGKALAYIRSTGTLIMRDLKSGEEKTLIDSWNRPGFQFSPDGKWIAYEIEDAEHNADIWVMPVEGPAPGVNISQHPDRDTGPQWSADGQVIAFTSARHGFDNDLYMVFLSPELDEMASVDRDEYFEKQAGAVKKRKAPKSSIASGKIALAGKKPETQPAESQPTESQPSETQPAETQPAETQPAAQPTDDESLDFATRVRRLVEGLLEERDEKKAKKKDANEEKKYEYELDTCYRRIRRVTSMPGDQYQFALAPDGQSLVFTSTHEGGAKLYSIKWNGKSQKRILSSSVGALRWALDGKKLYYLRGGVPNSCGPTGSGTKSHGFRAKMAISRRAEAEQKFNDGARRLGMQFYHPTMKGLDWPALTRKYRELALQTTTLSEFNAIFNMLLGELNASHLGLYGPRGGGVSENTGYLGCTFDPTFEGPGLKVTRVLPDSPADKKDSRLVAGDILLKVNGVAIGPDSPIDATLINTIGDEVILEYQPSPDRKKEDKAKDDEKADDANKAESKPAEEDTNSANDDASEAADEDSDPKTPELIIRPTSFGRISSLMYQDWVRANQAYVDEKTEGRVGYLHIRSMGQASFETFERDLYAAANGRDGLIIDVRSNGGGWTADWVMAVLNVKRHAYTVVRDGVPGYPQDRLIFYSWTKPATMMCNQQSFSNAEIVSHAFKNLKRGPLVGMTTYGGVISTGAYSLIDGAYVRMPGRGWYTLPDDKDMELNGAEPDVKVPITPTDEVLGNRPQLDAAIQATLEQIEQAPAQP